jgi:hypothetical protein
MSFALPEQDIRDPDLEDGPLARALERMQRNFDAIRTGFPLRQDHLVSLPQVELWRETPAPYSGAGWDTVTFDSMAEDERGLFTNGGFDITIPKNGLYLVMAAVGHPAHGGTNSSAWVQGTVKGDIAFAGGAPTPVGSGATIAKAVRLEKGEGVTLSVLQNSGGPLNYGGTPMELSLGLVRLGN